MKAPARSPCFRRTGRTSRCARKLRVTPMLITLASLPCLRVQSASNTPFLQPHLTFDRCSVDHGFSQTLVRCIWQDRQGFMWFGRVVFARRLRANRPPLGGIETDCFRQFGNHTDLFKTTGQRARPGDALRLEKRRHRWRSRRQSAQGFCGKTQNGSRVGQWRLRRAIGIAGLCAAGRGCGGAAYLSRQPRADHL